ncbi:MULTISPECIES: hypothetical protein [unclassified Mesorhizobium]|jgi:hypothetical protein|nr:MULTISPECIES: hypothetical protein [unclassified Mesorhizobium]
MEQSEPGAHWKCVGKEVADIEGYTMKTTLGFLLAAGVLTPLAGSFAAEPLKTMTEVGAALQNCWVPPSTDAKGSVTLQFSFKRDGTLIGPPRPTNIQVDGEADKRKQLVQAATDAVQHCMPLAFEPKLADGIAGTMFTLRLESPKRQ